MPVDVELAENLISNPDAEDGSTDPWTIDNVTTEEGGTSESNYYFELSESAYMTESLSLPEDREYPPRLFLVRFDFMYSDYMDRTDVSVPFYGELRVKYLDGEIEKFVLPVHKPLVSKVEGEPGDWYRFEAVCNLAEAYWLDNEDPDHLESIFFAIKTDGTPGVCGVDRVRVQPNQAFREPDQLYVQYSPDGESDWVWEFDPEIHNYRRESVGKDPYDWTDPMRITGIEGDDGPGIVYRGPFEENETYFYMPGLRRDVVDYAGDYYLFNVKTGEGGTEIEEWDEDDWEEFGETFDSVATKLLLAHDATIQRTLTMGWDGEESRGIIRSIYKNDYGEGEGFWLGQDQEEVAKVDVGDDENYLRWDGSELLIKGSITVTGGDAVKSDDVGDLGWKDLIDDEDDIGDTVITGKHISTGAISADAGHISDLNADDIDAGTISTERLAVIPDDKIESSDDWNAKLGSGDVGDLAFENIINDGDFIGTVIDSGHIVTNAISASAGHISDLNADDIITGTLKAADVTIRSGDIGEERVELNGEGFYLLDDSGDKRFEISRYESVLANDTILYFKFEGDEQGRIQMGDSDVLTVQSNFALDLYASDAVVLSAGKEITFFSGDDMEFHSPVNFFDNIAIDDLYANDSPINLHNRIYGPNTTIETGTVIALDELIVPTGNF